MRTPALAALLLLAPLAGCIEPPQDDQGMDRASTDLPSADLRPPADRVEGMTASEAKDDKVGPCTSGGVDIPPGAVCAQRVLTVTGRIGVTGIPVDLDGANGPIEVVGRGSGDAWSFTATIKVRGLTQEDARRALDEAWSWSHEDGAGGHHVKAGRTGDAALVGSRVTGTSYALVLPEWVTLTDVRLDTSNGPVTFTGLQADRLEADTSNGPIKVAARVRDAVLDTSNGPITATLLPTASGEWEIDTSNGPIKLLVREHPGAGYDLDASTSNGPIDIRLTQGKVKEEGRGHKSFRTDGFEARAIQTTVKLDTSNGPVTVNG